LELPGVEGRLEQVEVDGLSEPRLVLAYPARRFAGICAFVNAGKKLPGGFRF
jgi:hypothetical protein